MNRLKYGLHTWYKDAWALLRPGDAGWTEDTDVNGMLRALRGDRKQVRFDRVLWRGSPGSWEPAEIELLGTRPLRPDDAAHSDDEAAGAAASGPIWPSDHFGLCLTLRRPE
eukprot:m51a1_g9720 putative metal-dependent hydrolase (111) ;mRNA; f:1445052-1451900